MIPSTITARYATKRDSTPEVGIIDNEEIHRSTGTVTAREAGLVRTRRVRAYPDGNIREQVAACESLEALRELVAALGRLVAAQRVSRRAIRLAQKAIDARRQELEARLVVVPGSRGGRRTKGGLYRP